jgi:universal stress protein A
MSDYHNILVAIDFSEASHMVIQRAIEIAGRNKTPLTVLHVVEYMPPMDIAYEPVPSFAWIDEEALLERSRTSLATFCKKHQLTNEKQVVVLGAPKYEICQYARDNQTDLLILGAHGRHGIKLLLGSTANGVLHDMPCDVLAVKLK